jgi:acetyltransferase
MFPELVKQIMRSKPVKRKIHDPNWGKLRVVGLISGSGNSLWKVLDLQKALEATWEGSPFEITGCFSSDPAAGGMGTAEKWGIPAACLDLRQYYRDRGKKFSDREVRREYDRELLKLIEPFNPDIVLLAGYVWATSSEILDRYTVINVHPADLSVMKDGKRAFAGANGVGDALTAREKQLHTSSHLATSHVDNGPIFFISPGVEVDYELEKTLEPRDFMKACLTRVNEQSRLIAARTIHEVALGHFEIDTQGALYYRNQPVPLGVRIDSWEENRPLHERHTEALLRPGSLAVVGASAKGGIGTAVVKSVKALGFQGPLAVVNRNGDDVLGVRGYKKMDEIPHGVDMAVITVPSPSVIPVVEECGRKGVKALVCISAGFKETGEEGARAELQLKALVDKYNMRMIGPNCMGISNNHSGANLNTTILHDVPVKGNIALVTQSGGLGAVLLDYSKHLGIGFSVVASLGNQADVTVNDLLPLLAEDEATRVILLYLETIPDYRRFRRLAARISGKKPIILLKAGRTEAGAKAASSHTGSLAGNDKVTESLIESAGIIRAETVYSAFFTASMLSKTNLPRGKRIAIVTNGGGPGIIASDAFSRAGFEVPTLSSEARKRLKPLLMLEASCANPIDLVAPAPPEHYAAAIREVMTGGEYDAVALLCIPPATIHTEEVARGVVKGLEEMAPDLPRLPLLSCFFGPNLGQGAREVLNAAGYPCLEYPEQIAEVLKNAAPRPVLGEQLPHRSPAARLARVEALMVPDKEGYLPQEQAWAVLGEYGFSLAAPRLVTSPEEVEGLGFPYPMVAKIDHPEVIHKSDAGGVILNISDLTRARQVVTELLAKFPGARGVVMQPQITSSREMILGSVRDDASGTAVMVGLGGIFVELMEDVSFIHVPFGREAARAAVDRLKSVPLLTGYRGKPGVNIESLLDQMERLNLLLLDFPEIREMDLNPLMYSEEKGKFIITDCRIRIQN